MARLQRGHGRDGGLDKLQRAVIEQRCRVEGSAAHFMILLNIIPSFDSNAAALQPITCFSIYNFISFFSSCTFSKKVLVI